MLGKCESCGTPNVEVSSSKENGKEKLLCNQCRPADGAYGYWWQLIQKRIICNSLMYFIMSRVLKVVRDN